MLDYLRLMSEYNKWMNRNIYELCMSLSAEKLKEETGAYFGSILGTLNHIMVGDVIWLKRFADHPNSHSELEAIREMDKPKTLDTTLYNDIEALYPRRKILDDNICTWVSQLTEQDLNSGLSYKNMKGEPSRKGFGKLIVHFFNHQTHHRGQITTLLSQQGVDIGITDLLTIIPELP